MICGVERHRLGGKHLRRHGLTTAEYKLKFPDAKLWSEKYHLNNSKSHIGVKRSEASKLKQSKTRMGFKHSPETIKKMFSKYRNTKPELKMKKKLEDWGISFVQHKQLLGFNHQFDFYIPHLNLAIEVDGCYWHGCEPCGYGDRKRERDIEINEWCDEHNIKLVRYWEHDLMQETFQLEVA